MLSGTDQQFSSTPSSSLPGPEAAPAGVPNLAGRGEGISPEPDSRAPSPVGPGEGVSGEGRSVRGDGRRKLIAALLGIQLLLAAIALGVWVWTPDRPTLPPLPAGTAPLVGSGATYESALPIAQAQASAWLPGAVLLNASMQVDWPWSVPAGTPTAIPGTGWLTYDFVAPWHPPG